MRQRQDTNAPRHANTASTARAAAAARAAWPVCAASALSACAAAHTARYRVEPWCQLTQPGAKRDASKSHEGAQQGTMTWARNAGVNQVLSTLQAKHGAHASNLGCTWLNADGSHADAAALQVREKLLCQDGPVPLQNGQAPDACQQLLYNRLRHQQAPQLLNATIEKTE